MTVTILTVDDSRTMRDMLRMALVDAGFRVVQAEDGLHGLDVLRGERPQVVITDINMPRMDGFGFIEAVRQDAQYRAIPILVLTTESDDEKKLRARRAGATGRCKQPSRRHEVETRAGVDSEGVNEMFSSPVSLRAYALARARPRPAAPIRSDRDGR